MFADAMEKQDPEGFAQIARDWGEQLLLSILPHSLTASRPDDTDGELDGQYPARSKEDHREG
jgi:hypothetical protein